MSFWDFNDAPEQQGDIIPAKTLARVVMTIRPGGHGDGGWLKQSDSGFEYLDAEMTVTSSPHATRKLWQNIGVGGPTDGHQKAAQISRALLRAILESARNVNPKDESDKARQARQVSGWQDFDGIEFAIEIGVEKDKNNQYPDKNRIQKVLTPDHKDYQRVMAGETIVPAGVASNASPQPQPAWGGVKEQPPSQPEVKPANPIPEWAK